MDASAARRFLVLVALGVLPWTVLVGESLTLVFAFGLLNTNPLHLTTLYDYLFRFTGGFAALPTYLRAWPVSVLLYLGSLVSALSGVVWREDLRVTGGLLALAGVSHVSLAVGLSRGIGRMALPTGTVLLLAVAWWLYWPALRRTVP